MKRLSLILVGLAITAGCSSQTASRLGGSQPLQAPDQAIPGTTLKEVKLHATPVQAIAAPVRARIVDDMRFRAAEAGGPGAAADLRLAKVGDLKKQHLFPNTYLSDDAQVVLATSEGQFQIAGAGSGAASKHVYTRLVGMFDPVSGETLGTGFKP